MVRLAIVLVALSACGRIHFTDACSSELLATCGGGGGDLDDLILDSGEYRYDTDAGTLASPSGEVVAHASTITSGVRVITAGVVTITATATLRAFGTLPLAIVADEITIDGAIDVAGRSSERGAGGAACDATMRTGASDMGGGAGGGGGGFGARGGDGMTADFDDSGAPAGMATPGSGGPAVADVTALRGGCDGSAGGDGRQPGGAGGNAGGGILLHASRTSIQGVVRAHGAGGGGAAAAGDGGGGGGASGGMIALEADDLSLVAGVIVANGGGGGEGADSAAAGDVGADGVDDLVPALGGGVGDVTEDNNGGDGGYVSVPDGQVPVVSPGIPFGGAGGGGGGVGIITIRATTTNFSGSVVSPAPRTGQ